MTEPHYLIELSADQWATVDWAKRKIAVLKTLTYTCTIAEPKLWRKGQQHWPVTYQRSMRRILLTAEAYRRFVRLVGLSLDIIAHDAKSTYWYQPLKMQLQTTSAGCPNCGTHILSNCRPIQCVCGQRIDNLRAFYQPYRAPRRSTSVPRSTTTKE